MRCRRRRRRRLEGGPLQDGAAQPAAVVDEELLAGGDALFELLGGLEAANAAADDLGDIEELDP